MEPKEKTEITVQTTINAPVETVWKCWTTPDDITKWNYASDDWHTTWAENDLRVGGKFLSRMEAKDGSEGFDFWGIYDKLITHELIECTMGDGRKLSIVFLPIGSTTQVIETFDAEDLNSIELQRYGWQCILDNFKKHTETQTKQ
ncbi:MAG: SRPBCC family protein [Salinivirgaceae bacterium]